MTQNHTNPLLPTDDTEHTLVQTLTRHILDGADVHDPATNEELVRRIRNANLPIIIN